MHISNRIQQVSFLCSYLERFQQSAALPTSHSKQINGIVFLRCICILLYIKMDKKLGLIMPIRYINEIIFHFRWLNLSHLIYISCPGLLISKNFDTKQITVSLFSLMRLLVLMYIVSKFNIWYQIFVSGNVRNIYIIVYPYMYSVIRLIFKKLVLCIILLKYI